MARMYPERGPQPGASRAERLVYGLLRRYLDDSYLVFHSVPWPQERDQRRPLDVEIDFVVVHPRRGLLVLEVKGGAISRDGATGVWHSSDWNGASRVLDPDPIRQVTNAMYALRRVLQANAVTRPYFPHEAFARGVWFPECNWERHGDRADETPVLEPQLILDQADTLAPAEAVERLYDFFHAATPVGTDAAAFPPAALEMLVRALAPSRRGKSSLAVALTEENEHFRELTESQFAILSDIFEHRQLLVSGAAGTGKTILAMEAAWRLASLGHRVLFLCNNEFLAESLQVRVEADSRQDKPAFDIYSARTLSLAALEAAKLPLDRVKKSRSLRVYAEDLAASLAALDTRGDRATLRYDAVLVDEAQTIDTDIWPKFLRLLKEPKESRLFLFYDADQREDPTPWKPPIAGDKVLVPLRENLRNTQAVFGDMRQLNPNMEAIRCLGPVGRPTRFFWSTAQGIRTATGMDDPEAVGLLNALNWLVSEVGLRPEDILIISCRSVDNSRWTQLRGVGPYRFTWRCSRPAEGLVAMATVNMALGLEQKVVVVTELDGLSAGPSRRRRLFQAVSRAMNQLVVVGNAEDF